MNLRIRALIAGLRSYLPLNGMLMSTRGTGGGTADARYCYCIWLRYLCLSRAQGLDADPGVVAELGPGDSLGVGLAALIAGAEVYYAFDLVRHADIEKNLAVFDELVQLFTDRAPIPDASMFPEVRPPLDDYGFPGGVLNEQRMRRALDPGRLARLRCALENRDDAVIRYVVPWNSGSALSGASVDMLFSQAVLEHIDDLEGVYSAMWTWLKPGGLMVHTIDFRSHGSARRWSGHWQYSDFTWGLIRGRRPYLINREPLSTHLRLLKRHGFSVAGVVKSAASPACCRRELSRRFRNLSDEDLATSVAFIQSVKPA